MVAVFLLYAGRQPRLRPQSPGGDQAGDARDPESRRSLRHRARSASRGGLVDGGFTERYDYALQALEELPYDKWRDYDAEDTSASTRCACAKRRDQKKPQQIIADGTDWRFFDELKRELKA